VADDPLTISNRLSFIFFTVYSPRVDPSV